MKRLLLSFIILAGLAVLSFNSMAQVVIQNITYSDASPPYTVTASGIVPPCGSSTGTLTVSMLTSSLPAGTTYTIQAQSSLGYNQINTQTTVSNNQLITQNYAGLAGSPSGVFYSIVIKTPKIPPTFNDSTYLAVINLQVFSTKNFKAQVNPVNPLCPVPPNKGSASVNVISGTAPYNYTWSVAPNPNPGNAASAPNLDAGSYSVYVVDASGCDTTMPFTLVVQKPTVTLASNPPPPVCNPTFPLSITWTATPGGGWTPNPAGAYSWDGGVTFINSNTQTQSGILTYGNYSKNVIFKDINNCLSAQVTLSVPVDSKPQVTAVASPPNVCPGTTSTITATLVPPCSSIGATCQFSYDNGATYSGSNMYTTFPINKDTVIMVRVQNSTGCVSNAFPVTIDTTGKPKIIPVVSPSPICPNANYSITATCANNCAAIQMSFNNNALIAGSPQTYNQASAPAAPLVAATTTFPMYAIGANGCRFDTTVTVNVFPNTLIITGPNTPICANNNGSTVTLTASGFKPATVITWASTPAGLPGDGSNATSIVVSSPMSGSISYTVSGTDVNNCPRTTTQSITVNPQPTVMETGPAIYCQGTIATLNASGASTYQWYDATFTTLLSPSGNTFNVSPNATTTYGVIGTDANGCKDSATFVLNYHAMPTGSASASPSTICAGNTTAITLTANLPFTPNAAGGYSINDGISFSGTTASPYTFAAVGPFVSTTTINTKFQDNFGCISLTIPVTVTVLPFTATVTGASALCSYSSNGQATVTVSGGTPNYQYSVDIVAGPYTTFAGTSTVMTSLSAGVHTVYVRDNGNACNTSTPFTVVTPPVLKIDTTSHTDIQCFGGSNGTIAATVSGGTSTYNYYLGLSTVSSSNNAATNFTYTALAAGNYYVKVVDNNGCKDSLMNITIKQPAAAITAPGVSTFNACFGSTNGTLTINTAATGGWGGYTYTVGTSPVQTTTTVPTTFSNLAPGNYSVTLTDSKGCPFNAGNATVGSFSQIIIGALVVSSNCNVNGSVGSISASGGTGPYQYSTDDVTFSPSAPGPFNALNVNQIITVYVKDANNCLADTTYKILNIPRSIPILSVTPPKCPGGSDGTVTVDSVFVKIRGGAPFNYFLNEDKNPLVQVGIGGPAAANVPVVFSNLTGGDYVLQMSDQVCANYSVDSFRVYTSPTTYIVVKTPAQINKGFADISITQPPSFTTTSVALASDINKSTGSVIVYNLTGGTPFLLSGKNAYDLSIDNPAGLVTTALKDTLGGSKYFSFGNLAPGPKTIYIRDANGCLDTIQVIVPGKFFIPNLVSPNGDMHNDAFEVVSLPDNSDLKIFNRWGDRVYSNSNYDNKFDFHGLSDGVYYYDLQFDTGTKFKGWVQVLR
jgi:gliding motility-associated-like protein